MLKDQVEKKRVRGPSGRWTPHKLLHRMDAILEAVATGEPKYFEVVGLTGLSTEYAGLRRARARLLEKSLDAGQFNAPTVSFLVSDLEGEVIPSSLWQLWYRSPAERLAREDMVFVLQILPGRRALKSKELRLDPMTKKFVPVGEVTPDEAAGREGFAEQWGYSENLASYKRQILAKFRREDKEPLYEHMRNHPEVFEPYWKDLAAQGLDYKETLDEYYAKRRAESARFAAEKEVTILPAATPDTPERLRGVMTLQELRRILDGFGELPPEGAEDSDEGWQAFESRFLAANGPEAKGPLRAALSIVRRELGATAREAG